MVKKRMILAGTLVLLGGIIALALFLSLARPRQSVTFPTGSTFTFADTSYGKTRFIPPTGSWKRNLAFLPSSFLKWLKIDPGPTMTTRTNEMIIWLYVPPQGAADLYNGSAKPFSLVDENGVECMAPNFMPYSFPSYTGPNGQSLVGLGLTAFPRRSREFRLRFYSKDSNQKLILCGEFKIPNPAYREYPAWQADPLPIAKTNGDLTVTLTKLLTGTVMHSSDPAGTNEESWGRAFFTFTRSGQPARDWAVDTIEFSDGTGNRVQPAAWGNDESKPGQNVFNFRSPLWPAESAWKLNVKIKRNSGAKFAPGELWSIASLRLPALNTTNVLDLKTNLNGANLKLLSLVDESGQLPPETLSNYHRIRLVFEPPDVPPDMRFDVLSVTGYDTSTNAHPRDLQASPGGSMGNTEFYYFLPASAQTLDVKIGVYRELTAEFIVKPTIASVSNSVSKIK